MVSEDSLEEAAFLEVTAQRLTSAHPMSRRHRHPQGWVWWGSFRPAHGVLGAAPRPLLDTPVTHPPHRPTLVLLFFPCPKEKINIGCWVLSSAGELGVQGYTGEGRWPRAWCPGSQCRVLQGLTPPRLRVKVRVEGTRVAVTMGQGM